MEKSTKIVVTIGVVIVFLILSTVITGIRTDSGHRTPGILGLIVFAGLIGALRAIWKKDKNENKDENKDDDDNSPILQK